MQSRADINLPLKVDEVPSLRELVGWPRRDPDYPRLFELCQYWAAIRSSEGKLIAFGYMLGLGLEYGYIEDVMVDPAFQGQGLGRAIVISLLQEARRRGTSIVTTTFEAEHSKFYEGCGFKPSGAGVWLAPAQGADR